MNADLIRVYPRKSASFLKFEREVLKSLSLEACCDQVPQVLRGYAAAVQSVIAVAAVNTKAERSVLASGFLTNHLRAHFAVFDF